MISKKLQDALNAQINAEMWSAYLYLSMSVEAESKGLKGFGNWFFIQFREEQDHARILMNYLLARGGQVLLAPIAEVRTSWGSQLEAFEDTLAHEKKVTAMINNLYDMAVTEKDHATASMLKWFIDEQVEEEESATTIIDSLKLVSGDKMGVFMLDKELATRTYTQAAPLAGKEYSHSSPRKADCRKFSDPRFYETAGQHQKRNL